MKRPHGTGQIYVKSGAYYGRWRARDGRRRNKRLGPVRPPGSSEGLTRAMAEQALRRAQEDEPAAPVADDGRGRTVNDAANALRERLELQGARKSYGRTASRCSASTSLPRWARGAWARCRL